MAVRADVALRATEAVCERLGLPVASLDIIRSSGYVAIRVLGTPYLARVGPAPGSVETHTREMAITRALASAGAPVAGPAPVAKPLAIEAGCAVGLWVWIEVVPGVRTTMAELGTLLRCVHDAADTVDLDAFDLPAFPAPRRARARVQSLLHKGQIDAAIACRLVTALDELGPFHGDGLVHGDFRAANVVCSPAGPVLIDFDAASFGPREWDLTLPAQEHRHFGLSAAAFAAFADAYGGVGDAARFDALCRLRDVASAVWALTIAAGLPAFVPEARRRVASALAPDDDAPWSWAGLPSARP